MNLRQKVKQAKKQLATLENAPNPTSQWGMVTSYWDKSKLQRIIDYKRKPNRYFNWNDEYEINYKNLTYIAIYADFDKLAELKSHNGKPLKREVVGAFVSSIMATKWYDYAIRVSKMEKHPVNEKINDPRYEQRINTVTYSLKVSNDRTRQKRYHREPFYYQLRGEDKLYKPQRAKKADSETRP
ncbi:MAG: hypothetical protein RR603_06375 [Kurthia sp.]